MPYIKVEDRERLFNGSTPQTPGQLNFLITLLIDGYWHEHGADYQAWNDICGALHSAEHEYYRRKIGFYETQKMLENGDVLRYVPPSRPLGEREAQPAPKEPLRKGPKTPSLSAAGSPEAHRPGADL